MSDPYPYKRRPVLHWAALLCFIAGAIALGAWQLMVHPNTPLSNAWNPLKPLMVTDQVTSLTGWKLRRSLGDNALCLAALETGAQAQRKPDFTKSAQCGIAPQVGLSSVAGAGLKPVNTRCQTALRLAMWAQHGLQRAAQEVFGQKPGTDHAFLKLLMPRNADQFGRHDQNEHARHGGFN